MNIQVRNQAVLTELYENMGPGREHYMKHIRKACSENIVWYNSGFPVVVGIEAFEKFWVMLNESFGSGMPVNISKKIED